MDTLTALLESRASFVLAALFITWVAIFLLGLVVANLYTRLQRLELSQTTANGRRPYKHLLNRPIWSLLGNVAAEARPQIIFFLSANCKPCKRILAELQSASWRTATAVVWTDRQPDNFTPLPSQVVTVPGGAQVSNELGIRVTPFMLVVANDGNSVEASPVTNIDRLKRLAREIHTKEISQ